ELAQSLHKSCGPLGLRRGRGRAQEPDDRQLLRLLCPYRERPSRCAAQDSDELTPSQMIELHQIAHETGPHHGYRICGDRLAGLPDILQPIKAPSVASDQGTSWR